MSSQRLNDNEVVVLLAEVERAVKLARSVGR